MILTIFTPTYNRAYCLNQLYNSLVNQDNNSFLWLVVDDGSTDNTEELINSYCQESKINIQFVKQKNQGKHVATNTALDYCETELITCVDSDDYLRSDAVSIILKDYESHKDEKYLGMYYRRVNNNGENIATDYPEGLSKVGISDLYHNYDFTGDTMIVLKTKYLDSVRFPVFGSERFVTERVLYNEINHCAPMLLFEDGIYYSEYLEDGYTKNASKLLMKNPYGSAYGFLSESLHNSKFKKKVKNYAQFLSFVKLFDLDTNIFYKLDRPGAIVRLCGRCVRTHYDISFSKENLKR